MLYRITLLYFVLNFYVSITTMESTSTKQTKKADTEKKSAEAAEYDEMSGAKDLKDYDWDLWCKLQPNTHDCFGKGKIVSRFYYDTKLENCKSFSYKNCKIAFNNFETMAECRSTCKESGVRPLKGNYSSKIVCRLQPDFGNCFEYHPMFYFDVGTKKCHGFSYSGCGGNSNRFWDAQTCSSVCLQVMEASLKQNVGF